MNRIHPSNVILGSAAFLPLEFIAVSGERYQHYANTDIASAKHLVDNAQSNLDCVERLPNSPDTSIPNDLSCLNEVREHYASTPQAVGKLIFDKSTGHLIEKVETNSDYGDPTHIVKDFQQKVTDQKAELAAVEGNQNHYALTTSAEVTGLTAIAFAVGGIAYAIKRYRGSHGSNDHQPRPPRTPKEHTPRRIGFIRRGFRNLTTLPPKPTGTTVEEDGPELVSVGDRNSA